MVSFCIADPEPRRSKIDFYFVVIVCNMIDGVFLPRWQEVAITHVLPLPRRMGIQVCVRGKVGAFSLVVPCLAKPSLEAQRDGANA